MDKRIMENKINYKGEDLYSAAMYYYGVLPDVHNTVNVVTKLDEDIDPVLLRKALDLCQIRYPYLMVKVEKTLSEIKLVYNNLPFVIKNTKENFVLATADTNYHFIAFRYYDNTLVFSFFHGLIDGNASLHFLRTLLYYYVSEKYGEDISADGFRLATDDIDPEEYTDPYLSFQPDEDLMPLTTNKEKAATFRIVDKDSRVTLSDPYYFYLKVPQKAVIKHCKGNDASPATLFNLLIARAIKSLNPDTTDSIDGGLANDLRPALGTPKSHYSTVGSLTLSFDEKVQKLDVETQNTAFRGKTMLANDVGNIKVKLAENKKFFDTIREIPLRSEKEAMLQNIIKLNLGLNTFTVSYVGKANFGDIEKHIQGMYADPDGPGTNIILEVMAINEDFYLSFIQEWKERLYFEEFCQELKKIGLDYEVMEEGGFEVPKISF